jgi:type IV secretory pathway TraG/TraD family ATPase VirD4
MTTPRLYRLPTSTRARRRGLWLVIVMGCAGDGLLGLTVAASRIAYLAGNAGELGRPLTCPTSIAARVAAVLAMALITGLLCLRRQWLYLPAALFVTGSLALLTAYPVYPPEVYLTARRALVDSDFRPLLSDADRWGVIAAALALAAASPFLSPLIGALVRTGEDILRSGFILDDPSAALSQSSALPLGNVRYRGGERLVRAQGDVHVLVFAPPGSGKTTAYVIPTAMDWRGGAIILDVKGEIAAATAGHRRQNGSRILLLDPSRNEPTLARYNPLLSIRPYPHDVQDVSELAQLLVPDSPGADPFWKQSARTLLEGVILHVLYAEPEKTLAACYRYLTHPDQPIEKQFQRMLETDHDPAGGFGWTKHPRVQTAARTFLDMPGQTRGGVVANAQASLSPYADPILEAATATSDFALEDLYKPSERPVTLYLVIDPNSLRRLADHIRIVISQIASALTREIPTAREPILLLLDEFPVFGRMAVIETAIAYFRGYGVQCYLVVQHVGQLLAAYGKNESISPNCSVHIAFAPADLETAQQLSKRAGNQTVRYERSSVNRSSVSTQEADSGRPLFMPDEIMRLPKGEALVLRTGTLPLLVRPRPYFRDLHRVAAAKIPLPASEPTHPDLTRWLGRKAAPPAPPLGKRERRAATLSHLLDPEPLP